MFWSKGVFAAFAAALSVAVLAGPLAPAPAYATASCGGSKAGVDRGELVSLERVISSINRRWPGQLLNVCLDTSGGTPLYRVAWLSEGRKMTVVVDARSGRILSP